MRVGVAGGVEPAAGHVFAIARRSQEAFDDLVVGLRGVVGEEGVDLGRCRRQAGQVERHAAEEAGFVGFGGGLKALGGKFGVQEGVDRRDSGGGGGNWRTHRDLEAPVLPVGCALGNPSAEDVDLRGGDFFVRFRRRHDLFRVFA